jgi:hypothetical protein
MTDTKIITTRRWVIVGACGLYTGQSLTRVQMIKEHIADLHGGHRDYSTRPLTPEQRAFWEQCKQKGDFVLRATISYEDPTWLTSESRLSECEPSL